VCFQVPRSRVALQCGGNKAPKTDEAKRAAFVAEDVALSAEARAGGATIVFADAA